MANTGRIPRYHYLFNLEKIQVYKDKSGSIRVLGYTVYSGLTNCIYGIFLLKFGHSVYHLFCLQLILNITYTTSFAILGILPKMLGILSASFRAVLVYHYSL